MNEVELIHDFRKGKCDAFKQIYYHNYKALWNYASRITLDKVAAEGVINESFVKTWEHREKFKDLKEVLSFLYVVTRNACFDLVNQRKKRNVSHDDIAYLSPSSEDVIHNKLVRTELLQAIMLEAEKLPVKTYETFKLIFVEGLKLPKAADHQGVSINTIKSQKASCIKRLRKALRKKSIYRVILF